MSSKKAGGTTSQNKAPKGKRLGIKVYGGEKVKTGMILIRQKGTIFHPGINVKRGRDHTLYACKMGVVNFFNRLGKQFVSVR